MAWRFALLKASKDPNKIIYSDEMMSVIVDPYAKSEKHFLVVAKKDISSISSAKKEDLEILKAMDAKGREIAKAKGEGKQFKFGYHAEPSMERLHLHVISDDFNSPALKNLKHWNSFNTSFFIDSEKAIKDLEKEGKVILPSKDEINEYLKTKLKCHKCEFVPKNMPKLKTHLLTHL
ncbi:aprataxin [Cimex lectularius]|uniref:HIT domain-containing protein n=1 Tax=Cimex lectularius TaxID=79782 RepID=A0A8I6RHM2_CIMLE|nr:aprataxin [Cimex lectularius]XP_014243449.1 aprataxin [Cimex lectularius]XP_014243450.1 aprataxin [Cimex lectularius]